MGVGGVYKSSILPPGAQSDNQPLFPCLLSEEITKKGNNQNQKGRVRARAGWARRGEKAKPNVKRLPGTLARERRMGTARWGEGEESGGRRQMRPAKQSSSKKKRRPLLLSPLFLGDRKATGTVWTFSAKRPRVYPDRTYSGRLHSPSLARGRCAGASS